MLSAVRARAAGHLLNLAGVSMSSVSYAAHGNPLNVLKVGADPQPKPLGPRDVAVKILAAPINRTDLLEVQGVTGHVSKVPAIAGSEGVGIITAVGSSITAFKVNDKVVPSRLGFGSWRHNAVVEESCVQRVSDKLSIEFAATVSIGPTAAYAMLMDFVALKAGDVVVQNGGNGAVGQAVIQLCKSLSVKTVSIIRSRADSNETQKFLAGLGADLVVTDELLASSKGEREVLGRLGPAKLGLNCVGGRSAADVVRLLGDDATLLTYGCVSNEPVDVGTGAFIFKNLTAKGFSLARWIEGTSSERRVAILNELSELAIADKLRVSVDRFPLDKFDLALARATSPHTNRKVLLTMV